MAGWHLAGRPIALAALCTAFCAGASAPAHARVAVETGADSGGSAAPYLECVPYARDMTGIRIQGDAHTWWDQAAGRYRRGEAPQAGAVMAFRPHANSRLGHVAAVSRVIDSRTVLISHANWSPIDGQRGQIEKNVRAVDVSPGNDWSEVRVWYAPTRSLGATHWPLYGFIYREKPDSRREAETPKRSASFGNDPIGAIIAGQIAGGKFR